MPGATHLYESADLGTIIQHQAVSGTLLAAICAAPAVVLAPMGILDEVKATCYPAPKFEERLSRHDKTLGAVVVEDRNVITSKGPGTAMVRTEMTIGVCLVDIKRTTAAHTTSQACLVL